MLPMTGNRSNIVWTERKALAPTYMAHDDVDFLAEVRRRFGDWLGELSLAGPRFAHPLGLLLAERYVARRLALISEAAHVIHPLVGQGPTLGPRAVPASAESLVQ